MRKRRGGRGGGEQRAVPTPVEEFGPTNPSPPPLGRPAARPRPRPPAGPPVLHTPDAGAAVSTKARWWPGPKGGQSIS